MLCKVTDNYSIKRNERDTFFSKNENRGIVGWKIARNPLFASKLEGDDTKRNAMVVDSHGKETEQIFF